MAAAEIRLGKISPEKAKVVREAMARARDADQAGFQPVRLRCITLPLSGALADMPLSLQRNAVPLNVAHALVQALELHRQGRLAEAERLYSAILAAKPDHADALHHLGLVKFANGQLIEALQLIAGAMRSRTPSPQVLLNHGLVLNALRLASVLRCPGYVRSTLNNIHAPFRTEPSGSQLSATYQALLCSAMTFNV